MNAVDVFERCEAYVDDAAGFPEQFKPGVVKLDMREYREARAAVEELIQADSALIQMCDELLNVNNTTLGRNAVRIQAAIIARFTKKLEANRAALARVQGGES